MPNRQYIGLHYPAVEITAWSQYGRGPYVLTAPQAMAFRAVQTHKDINTAAGQFQIQLTSVRDNQGRTYQDILHTMDYVEIRAGDLTRGSPLPILMRGFIDSTQESLRFDAAGNPTRTITITGSDWGKLLNIWQVQYLWPIDPYTAYIQSVAPFPVATTYAFGIPYTLLTAGQFYAYVLSNIVQPVASLYQSVIGNLPTPNLYTALPSFAQIAPTYVENFTGSYWSLLSYYQSPPFGELFLVDRDDGVALIVRLAPYHNYFGKPVDLFQSVNADAGAIEDPVVVQSTDIVSYQLGRSDSSAATYFLTQPDNSLPQVLGVPAFIGSQAGAAVITNDQSQGAPGASAIAGQILPGVAHPYLNAALEPKGPANPIYVVDMLPVYGFRPLIASSAWLAAYLLNISKNQTPQTIDQGVQVASQMSWWMYQVFRDNPDFLNGTITLHGREDLRIGRYLVVDYGDYQMEFYITSVDHAFTYAQPGDARGTWVSTLGVSRGRRLP